MDEAIELLAEAEAILDEEGEDKAILLCFKAIVAALADVRSEIHQLHEEVRVGITTI